MISSIYPQTGSVPVTTFSCRTPKATPKCAIPRTSRSSSARTPILMATCFSAICKQRRTSNSSKVFHWQPRTLNRSSYHRHQGSPSPAPQKHRQVYQIHSTRGRLEVLDLWFFGGNRQFHRLETQIHQCRYVTIQVLVHCVSGISKSAALVMAFIMQNRHLTL